jgi:dolichol-phosphate mannosyltransferase
MPPGSRTLARVDTRRPPNGERPTPTPAPTLVVIPTYDESANIETVLRRVRVALPGADVLVVDDNSPDGTAAIAEALGAELGRISVLRRAAKDGLGAAYRAGFAVGLAHGYEILVEMDADLSHDPAALPRLVGALDGGADLVIGSRYVTGAAIPDWSARRRALSRYGNRYAGFVLGVDIRDLTSGYRAYRAEALRCVHAETTRSTGYAFQIELASRVARSGHRVVELPIEFNDRTAGSSKMSTRITAEALARVTWWGLRDRWRRAAPAG